MTDCESSSLNRHQTDDPDRVRVKQVRSRKAEALRECDAVLRRLPVWYKGDYVSITNRRQMLSVKFHTENEPRPGEPYILQLQGAQKPN